MFTQIIKIDKYNTDITVKKAGEIIRAGGLVIFPTETVYGIGANALNENSASKIYNAKGRPSDNPLIVHISDEKDIYTLGVNIDNRIEKIISAFWPGPLTLILNKSSNVPYRTTGGLDTVAVRMPSNIIANKIIKESGVPIAAPSANISGRPSITSEEFIKEEFEGKVDMIILDNNSSIGIESTVIDTTGDNIVILRPGFVTKSDIERVINEDVHIDTNLKDNTAKPKSPGMKYKHYSPNCEVYIVDGDNKIEKIYDLIKKDSLSNKKSVVIGKEEYQSLFNNFISLGKDDITAAKNIFKVLRQLDKENFDKAYFINMSDTELEFSIMDRMKKASGYKII